MTAAAMIAELAQAGIHLSRHGDRLHVEAKPGTVTPAIREQLAAHKPELLALLEHPYAIRTRLLNLALSEGLSASVVDTIPADELHLYAELDDTDLLLPLHLRARCSTCAPRGTT